MIPNNPLLRPVVTTLAVLATVCILEGTASAQYFSHEYSVAMRNHALRNYRGYPYQASFGLRYDPYWSYNSSYFPTTYHGDGSYYGLGYSGYAGRGGYGGYYYW